MKKYEVDVGTSSFCFAVQVWRRVFESKKEKSVVFFMKKPIWCKKFDIKNLTDLCEN